MMEIESMRNPRRRVCRFDSGNSKPAKPKMGSISLYSHNLFSDGRADARTWAVVARVSVVMLGSATLPGMICAGLKEQLASAGKPEHEKLTAFVKPTLLLNWNM
jgi:hypothetical protein